jgi:hypothetical protein
MLMTDLEAENERLKRALMNAECIIDSHIGDIEDGNRSGSKDYTSPEYMRLLIKGRDECRAALSPPSASEQSAPVLPQAGAFADGQQPEGWGKQSAPASLQSDEELARNTIVQQLLAQARADEAEECAKVAYEYPHIGGRRVAAALRARHAKEAGQ